jgi:hypothetical protein
MGMMEECLISVALGYMLWCDCSFQSYFDYFLALEAR